MRIVRGAAAARGTLLRRRGPGELELPAAVRQRIREVFEADLTPEEVVRRIIDDVRRQGDAALAHYSAALDGVAPRPLEVSEEEVAAAYGETPAELVEALRHAAARVRAYHEAQRAHATRDFFAGGVGQMVRPLERVGLYAPGTAVVYPSSVIMTAVPALVAGVKEVILATPASPDGSLSPLKLVAAEIAGVHRIFAMGGAQAIAALAYGTESVPQVDKIVGPGNIFVALAQRAVFGDVAVGALFGPSETVVIADEGADPALCAADLLAQAEHDELASPILITTSEKLSEAVSAQIEEQAATLERRDVALAALAGQGGAAIVDSIEEAIDLANEYAPEHLCLLVRHAPRYLGLVRHAGGVFLGEGSPEVVGDYTAGPSHVMPTGGSARFSSPLGVHDFLKVTSVVQADPALLRAIGPGAALLARAEGFTAHARAIELRLEGGR